MDFAKLRSISFVGPWFSARSFDSEKRDVSADAALAPVEGVARAYTSRKELILIPLQPMFASSATTGQSRCCFTAAASGTASDDSRVNSVVVPWSAVSGVEYVVMPASSPGPHCPCMSVTLEVNLACVAGSEDCSIATAQSATPSRVPVDGSKVLASTAALPHQLSSSTAAHARYGLLTFTAYLHELEHVRFFGHVAHRCWAAHGAGPAKRADSTAAAAGPGGPSHAHAAGRAADAGGGHAALSISGATAAAGGAAGVEGEGADFGLSNAYIHHLRFWPAAFRACYSPRLRRALQRALPLVFLFLSICSLVSALRTLYVEVPALQLALDATVDRIAAALGPVSEVIADAAARAQTLIASLALAGFVQRAVQLLSLWTAALAAAVRGICAPAIFAGRLLLAVLTVLFRLATSIGARLLASLGALVKCGALRRATASLPAMAASLPAMASSAASCNCRSPLLCLRAAADCCCRPVRPDARKTALRNFLAWLLCESRVRARAAAEQLAASRKLRAALQGHPQPGAKMRDASEAPCGPAGLASRAVGGATVAAAEEREQRPPLVRRQASVWLDAPLGSLQVTAPTRPAPQAPAGMDAASVKGSVSAALTGAPPGSETEPRKVSPRLPRLRRRESSISRKS